MGLRDLKNRLKKMQVNRPKPPDPCEKMTDAERVMECLKLFFTAIRRERATKFYRLADGFEKRYNEIRDYVTVGKFDKLFEDGVKRDLEQLRNMRLRHMANQRTHPWPDELPGT
jgi:hypothetical protein